MSPDLRPSFFFFDILSQAQAGGAAETTADAAAAAGAGAAAAAKDDGDDDKADGGSDGDDVDEVHALDYLCTHSKHVVFIRAPVTVSHSLIAICATHVMLRTRASATVS